MKVFFNGFWSGFFEKTNAIHVEFFLDLLHLVFNCVIEIGTLTDSDILFETIFYSQSYVSSKDWKYTFLFSGESRLSPNPEKYSCVLWGERNHDNVVNLPLFVAFMECSKFTNRMRSPKERITKVPSKLVCAVIGNPNGAARNKFLDKLEKHMKIDYAGPYRNNIGGKLECEYYSKEFLQFVGQYKFIIGMENSRGDTYITEKIIHGLVAGSIPVYWGCKRVANYINKNRFLLLDEVDEAEMNAMIWKMQVLANNDTKWLAKVNQPIFPDNRLERTPERIARDIRNIIFAKPFNLSQIYFISSPDFEPLRFKRLKEMVVKLKIPSDNVSFLCPTYKQTVSSFMMQRYVRNDLVTNVRSMGMKRSEISLILNYRAVLQDITDNYSNGIFLVLESDVVALDNILDLNDLINALTGKSWDLIHIGKEANDNARLWSNPYFLERTMYREFPAITFSQTSIEDISKTVDKVRFSRKLYTRCTDSFVWNYAGCQKFLQYMKDNDNYGAPLDLYMVNMFENELAFKHYWSNITYFMQGSNAGLEPSVIQTDRD